MPAAEDALTCKMFYHEAVTRLIQWEITAILGVSNKNPNPFSS